MVCSSNSGSASTTFDCRRGLLWAFVQAGRGNLGPCKAEAPHRQQSLLLRRRVMAVSGTHLARRLSVGPFRRTVVAPMSHSLPLALRGSLDEESAAPVSVAVPAMMMASGQAARNGMVVGYSRRARSRPHLVVRGLLTWLHHATYAFGSDVPTRRRFILRLNPLSDIPYLGPIQENL